MAAFVDTNAVLGQNYNSDDDSPASQNNVQNNANYDDEKSETGQSIDAERILRTKVTGSLPHPKAANMWRTKEFILSGKLPEQESLIECQKETQAIGDQAMNHETMLENRNILLDAILKHSETYHWCFYYSVFMLDNKLNEYSYTSGKSYADLHNEFVRQMKSLWVLARALDSAFNSHHYFGYLRKRYVEISQSRFGRTLSVISPPLGDGGRNVLPLNPKPAGVLGSE